MQFKRQAQGRRVQVLAYRGYDKEKRRAIVRMLGSIDVCSCEPSGGLMENLTDDEKIELQSYLEKNRQADEIKRRQSDVKSAACRISDLADAIRAGAPAPPDVWGADVWAAISALTQSMRQAGYPKPRKAPQKTPDAPMPSQAGCP